MAHHQGMSLLAIVNLLFDNPLRQYFHAEPQVLATELLLHERVPATALAEADQASLLSCTRQSGDSLAGSSESPIDGTSCQRSSIIDAVATYQNRGLTIWIPGMSWIGNRIIFGIAVTLGFAAFLVAETPPKHPEVPARSIDRLNKLTAEIAPKTARANTQPVAVRNFIDKAYFLENGA